MTLGQVYSGCDFILSLILKVIETLISFDQVWTKWELKSSLKQLGNGNQVCMGWDFEIKLHN